MHVPLRTTVLLQHIYESSWHACSSCRRAARGHGKLARDEDDFNRWGLEGLGVRVPNGHGNYSRARESWSELPGARRLGGEGLMWLLSVSLLAPDSKANLEQQLVNGFLPTQYSVKPAQ
ncbi:hypothetical protein L7F22_045037 [Adiantum nelumboides]|nr:hypothetical protein [Adiantum nelumboides]